MSKFLTIFFAGLALGLLLSEENRKKVMDVIGDAQDSLQDSANTGLNKAEKAVGSLESRIRKAIN